MFFFFGVSHAEATDFVFPLARCAALILHTVSRPTVLLLCLDSCIRSKPIRPSTSTREQT